MKKILIVEDEPSILMVLEMFFVEEGYSVLTASSGEDGLKVLEAEKPQLVLLDLKMRGIGGKGFIFAMRKNELYANIPVIIMTGSVPGPDFPPQDYYQGLIGKPFDLDVLVAQVERCLN